MEEKCASGGCSNLSNSNSGGKGRETLDGREVCLLARARMNWVLNERGGANQLRNSLELETDTTFLSTQDKTREIIRILTKLSLIQC